MPSSSADQWDSQEHYAWLWEDRVAHLQSPSLCYTNVPWLFGNLLLQVTHNGHFVSLPQLVSVLCQPSLHATWCKMPATPERVLQVSNCQDFLHIETVLDYFLRYCYVNPEKAIYFLTVNPIRGQMYITASKTQKKNLMHKDQEPAENPIIR